MYNRGTNPLAAAWFRVTAAKHLGPLDAYGLAFARYGVVCEVVFTDHPGRVVYDDEFQVVACPD